MITVYGLVIRWRCYLLCKLTAKMLLFCYGEFIGATDSFLPRKVVDGRLGLESLLCNMTWECVSISCKTCYGCLNQYFYCCL